MASQPAAKSGAELESDELEVGELETGELETGELATDGDGDDDELADVAVVLAAVGVPDEQADADKAIAASAAIMVADF